MDNVTLGLLAQGLALGFALRIIGFVTGTWWQMIKSLVRSGGGS